MDFRKITAIIRPDALPAVERCLEEASVPGGTVSRVKGYGDRFQSQGLRGSETLEGLCRG